MERELMLPVKTFDQGRIDREIAVVQKMFPFIESEQRVKETVDIYDSITGKFVKDSLLIKALSSRKFVYYIFIKN